MTKVSLEVVNFDKEMRRVQREVKRLANATMEERADLAVKTLKVVTPVDTGEARSGWSHDKGFNYRTGYFESTIRNPVEHIVYLNRGHSKQAPKYFIEQVLVTLGVITS